MNINIRRSYFAYDNEEVNCIIQLDEATLEEIKLFRGEVCGECEIKSDWLIKFLHDNSVGKVSDSGSNRFIKCLRLGELEISMQLSYQLFKLRDSTHPGYFSSCLNGGDAKLMTEEEFQKIINKEAPSETYIDVCIWNNVNGEEYQRATQMRIWEIDNFLREIIYKNEMNCQY